MKQRKKAALVALFSAIALINVLVMAIRGLDLRDQLDILPCALLKVESGSMEPVLSAGDLLVVWETPYQKLNAGDLITFHHGTELITHELLRREGSRLVTKGVANQTEDASIGPEEYCAKVILTISGGGKVLDALTTPVSLVLCVLLILVLFYGMSVIKRVQAIAEKTEYTGKRPTAVRISASLAAVSMLTLTPFMTAAKYTAKINKNTIAIAGAKYFSSNFISGVGTDYYIQGWNGQRYAINLSVSNFSNDLLFNTDGNDLVYALRVVKTTEGGYQTDYDLTLVPPEGIQTIGELEDFPFSADWPNVYDIAGDTEYGPYLLTGSDDGGKTSNFQIQIVSHKIPTADGEVNALQPGDRIQFQIYAGTDAEADYYQELKGVFTLEVASSDSFLSEQRGNSAVGTSLVTYTLRTSQVGGDSTRNIKVSWNKDKIYINEYESTILNLKSNYPNNFCRDDGSGRGYAILPLQAYSSVALQFFKFDANVEVLFTQYSNGEGDIYTCDPDIYAVELAPES